MPGRSVPLWQRAERYRRSERDDTLACMYRTPFQGMRDDLAERHHELEQLDTRFGERARALLSLEDDERLREQKQAAQILRTAHQESTGAVLQQQWENALEVWRSTLEKAIASVAHGLEKPDRSAGFTSASVNRLYPEDAQRSLRVQFERMVTREDGQAQVIEYDERGYASEFGIEGARSSISVTITSPGETALTSVSDPIELSDLHLLFRLRVAAPKANLEFKLRPQTIGDTVLAPFRIEREAHVNIPEIDAEYWLEGDERFLRALLAAELSKALHELAALDFKGGPVIRGKAGELELVWAMPGGRDVDLARLVGLLKPLACTFDALRDELSSILVELSATRGNLR
jgi:hypothetical protein